MADASPTPATASDAFSDRVMTVFATSVVTTGLGIAIGFLLARVLGPAGKGDFYLVTLMPVTLMVLTQFGLPEAFGLYAARGQTVGINAKTLVLAAALAGPAIVATVALLPVLRDSILDHIEPGLILLGLAAFPFQLHATFTTGVVLGRQAVRSYTFVNLLLSVASVVLFLTFIAVLGQGVVGALWAYLLVNVLSAIGFLVASIRAAGAVKDPTTVSYRKLLRFGLPLYPGSLTEHFSFRLDVFLIAALIANPAAPLGYYSMAVTTAQLVQFLPSAVSRLFFPHVAGAARADSDRQVPMLSRVTLLMTAAMAVALVPAAVILIRLLLPAFEDSLSPLLVLLPGVVAMSLTEVLSSYVAGVGSTGLNSSVKIGAMVVNVVANLMLIPRFGIVGAAAASLISYSVSAIAFTVLASRLSHQSVAAFWVPRVSDVRFMASTILGMGIRMLQRSASLRSANRP